MPDFRKNIEDAEFKPDFTTQTTTGPNAEGDQQTWQNPRPQLTQSSAQELAELMGAKLTQVSMSGPYAQDKPQWQLDFGTGDLHDAAMVYDRYQRAPEHFSQNMADEIAYGAKYPGGVGAAGGGPATAPPPAAPPPSGGGGMTPGPNWPPAPPPNLPGPVWPNTPPPNIQGPDWTNVPPPPPPTGVNPTPIHPGTGVGNPGGYTPPPPMGVFQPPISFNGEPQQLPGASTWKPYTPRPHNDTPVSPLLLPQMLNGELPPAAFTGGAPGGLLTLEELKRRAGGGLPASYTRPGGLLAP